MSGCVRKGGRHTAVLITAMLLASQASASSIAQNSAWNVTRTGSTQTYRVVAYGDSIFAGYTSATSIARRAAPHVMGEYLAALSGQKVEIRRRCQSGAVAADIYNTRLNTTTDRAFMQDANTRVVMFEMCGNDYLQARSSFRSAAGACNYSGLQTAGTNCRTYTELAMKNINQYAHANTKVKVVMNLYYPGFDADNAYSACTDPVNGDPANGNRVHMRTLFLPLLAESNWWTCHLAEQYGFECADAFAQYMARDYDGNGDGRIDSDAIRYLKGESLDDYRSRILSLAGTLRDANLKLVTNSTTFDYIQSDDTHPTFEGATASAFLTTPGGDVAVQFATAGPYPDGKNPHWNWNGHDRMGWGLDPTGTLTPPACGNGAIETVWLPSGTPQDEACDDGNGANGDGCSSRCEVEPGYACSGTPSLCAPICGDGLVVGGEECDDSNLTPGDGCSPTCTTEDGYACMGSPSSCAAVCGDGLVVDSEGCDDGNALDGDGCAACAVEDGWACAGAPSACAPVCGDGLVRGTEECDDGDANGTAQSCCAATCTFQAQGTLCDDGDICTDNVCNGANQCIATPKSCDDGNVCTTDACQAGVGCVNTPNGDPSFYTFNGFFAPVDNAPVYNIGQAGRTYPLKWQLPMRCTSGYIRRLSAVTNNPIRFAEVPCNSTLPVDPVEVTDTAGNAGLRYDAGSEQFTYNWQTAKSFAGKCYQVVLELDNGTTPFALFKFK
ncbi:PxKF domain-containing protein [bacterium]|nr:PxKF domain-containing protein [bacterium]